VKQYQRMSEIEVRFFDFPPLLRAHGKVFGSNGFNRIEQCRRVAARYDNFAANGLAFIQLGSISERHLPLAFSHASDLRDIQSPISDSD
jgi:transposase